MEKKEKIIIIAFIIFIIGFSVWSYENKIKDLENQNGQLENENFQLQQKKEKYSVAFYAANENINSANYMIEDVKNSSELSCAEIRSALDNLIPIDIVEDPMNPKEEMPERNFTDEKSEKESCERSGGKWSASMLTGRGLCNMPTTDSGKECTDEKECDGTCIAETEGATKGWCSGWTIVLGCRYYMKNGVAASMCKD